MTKRVKVNIAASVHARLLKRRSETGEDFQFLLQRYASERFLYRLGLSSYRDRFILKGAMLYSLWGGAVYRPTRDLDLEGFGSNSENEILAVFRNILSIEAGDDGIQYQVETLAIESILEEADDHGLRVQFQAVLGKARLPIQIDVGFGDAVEPPPIDVEFPTLLGHPAPHIRSYPMEAVVAEKMHAIVVRGASNSRMKDFLDLHFLSSSFAFNGSILLRSVAATFESRNTKPEGGIPDALLSGFYTAADKSEQWRSYVTRNKMTGVSEEFQWVGDKLMIFLGPLWKALESGITFDCDWNPGGPWRESRG